MKLLLVALVATLVKSSVASDSTVSVPSIISSVALPPTIESQIAEAYSYAGSILQIGSIISSIELTLPTLLTAESVIASYEESYSSLISYIEQVYETPSVLSPSSETSFSSVTAIHSTLASAIATVVSIEAVDTSLADIQSTLQYIERSQSSIITYLREFTAVASPTLYQDTHVVEAATITSPSIVPTFVEVYTAVSGYYAVSSALASLSSELYTLPLSINALIIGYISSPDVVPPSVRSLLSSCYPDVYSLLSIVTEFTKSHSTDLTAITDYLSAAETVSGLGSAIYVVMENLLPSLTYQVHVLSRVEDDWPSVYTDLEFLNDLMATSPSMYRAMTTVEQTFYSSPSVASSIYHAVMSPSSVTSPTKISYEEIAHQSLVGALNEISSFEYAYTQYSSTLCSIIGELTEAFVTERTLLTADSYISDVISPDTYSASQAIKTLFSIVSDLTTIMTYITDAVYYDTTLLCYEETIENGAHYYPQYASDLWIVYNSPSEVTSHFSYYSDLAADYSSLAYAFYKIVAAETSYPLLVDAEESFLTAAKSDSSVLSNFEALTEQESSLSTEVGSAST